MAVKEVTEVGEMTFSFRKRGNRTTLTAERNFKVFTDDSVTGPVEVIITGADPKYSVPLPKMDDYYSIDNEYINGLWVESIDPRRSSESPREWDVRIGYSSEVEKTLAGEGQGSNSPSGTTPAAGGKLAPDPLKRRTIINYDRVARKQIVEYDWSLDTTPIVPVLIKRAIVNSAGERFDPPLEDDFYNLLIHVEKHTTVAAYDPKKAADLQGSVNSDVFSFTHLGVLREFPAGTAKLNQWTAEESEEQGIVTLKNKFEIEIQYPNWDWEILNRGSYSVKGDGTHTILKARDNGGGDLGGTVMLDHRGVKLPKSEVTSGAFGPGGATPTVGDMTNIIVSTVPQLRISSFRVINGVNTMLQEDVVVTAISATTFTAVFTKNHAANAIVTGIPTFQTFKRRVCKFSQFGI